LDHSGIGSDQVSDNASVNMAQLHAYRLHRVQEQLEKENCVAAGLFDSINIRYATGARRSTLFNFHSPSRYAIVPVEGRPLLFDYHNAGHVYADLDTIAEYRPAISWCFFGAGPRYEERAKRWAPDRGYRARE